MFDNLGIYIILAFCCLALFLSYRLIGNGIYTITKHWREAVFLVLCALCGGLLTAKKDALAQSGFSFVHGTSYYQSNNIDLTIDHCKKFVTARLKGHPYEDLKPLKTRFIKANAKDNWKVCARVFGQHYWHDNIYINGRNGGRVLCDAYIYESKLAGQNMSSQVMTWCNTVFPPSFQKI